MQFVKGHISMDIFKRLHVYCHAIVILYTYFDCFTATVITEGNKTAVGGKQASLVCRYALPEKVKQVLWKKIVLIRRD